MIQLPGFQEWASSVRAPRTLISNSPKPVRSSSVRDGHVAQVTAVTTESDVAEAVEKQHLSQAEVSH